MKIVYVTGITGFIGSNLLEHLLQKFTKVISNDVKNYLDPHEAIKARNLKGGTAPAQVKKQVARALKLIKNRK